MKSNLNSSMKNKKMLSMRKRILWKMYTQGNQTEKDSFF